MSIIETRPVGKVILNENTPARKPRFEHYLIPYYQRGYRWETRHVLALLDDLHNFITSNEANYCLQPVVVSPYLDEDGLNQWEVIDGQQRLITLYVIFKYIKKYSYSLLFEKREKSTSFLRDLTEDTNSNENPDFHFISNAWSVVSTWFEKKTENDISYIDEFYSKVTKKVQVIWYQLPGLDEENKINIFNRLNIGKIPLTDAELIRALLLSKIRYGLTPREANMRQAEISGEWTQIEYELQKDELWFFLTNKAPASDTSRIELIFNIIAGQDAKNYSTYLWFENEIKSDDEKTSAEKAFVLWNRTKQTFSKLRSWYIRPRTYHYTGFLLSEDYSIQTLLKQSDTTKPAFEKWLKGEIKEIIKKINLSDLSYRDANMQKAFLLFNVLTIDKLSNTGSERFPFNQYKKTKYEESGGWSIEHIHAQRSEPMKEEKAIRTWLQDTLDAIKNIHYLEIDITQDINTLEFTDKKVRKDVKEIYPGRINEMLNSEKIDPIEFNLLKDELIDLFDSSSVHELDNLALLSKRHNSALNNAIFPVKRNKIIALEKAGHYIPACTRNVFLKFYSNSDNQPYYWSKDDKKQYFEAINNLLTSFSEDADNE